MGHDGEDVLAQARGLLQLELGLLAVRDVADDHDGALHGAVRAAEGGRAGADVAVLALRVGDHALDRGHDLSGERALGDGRRGLAVGRPQIERAGVVVEAEQEVLARDAVDAGGALVRERDVACLVGDEDAVEDGGHDPFEPAHAAARLAEGAVSAGREALRGHHQGAVDRLVERAGDVGIPQGESGDRPPEDAVFQDELCHVEAVLHPHGAVGVGLGLRRVGGVAGRELVRHLPDAVEHGGEVVEELAVIEKASGIELPCLAFPLQQDLLPVLGQEGRG